MSVLLVMMCLFLPVWFPDVHQRPGVNELGRGFNTSFCGNVNVNVMYYFILPYPDLLILTNI